MTNAKPLPVGTKYDGRKIIEVCQHSPEDTYQPYQYMLDDGTLVWIPVDADVNQEGEGMRRFRLEIRFGDGWAKVPGTFKSRDDAHWAAAEFRQKYGIVADDLFRVVELADCPEDLQSILAVEGPDFPADLTTGDERGS